MELVRPAAHAVFQELNTTMPITYKLVFAGPVGAGKTTAIQSLSDIEVVTTEASISDGGRSIKPTTTVAMDYGLMKLGSGDQVRLYGTPGQKRFDFMWDILSENALGLVMLVRADAPDPARDLREYVEAFRPVIDRTGLVVGITHGEKAGPQVRQNISRELLRIGLPPTVMDIDARDRAQMTALVRTLIHNISPA